MPGASPRAEVAGSGESLRENVMQKPGHPYVFVEAEGEVAPDPSMSPTLQPVPPLEESLELDESDLEAVTSEV